MNHWKRYVAPVAIICFADYGYATQYLTVEEAQKTCFPTANRFETSHVLFTSDQAAKIEAESGEKVQSKGQQIWKAFDNEKIVGYFIVDYVIGKHLVIDYAVAINLDGSVKQVEILEYRESYGEEIRNEDWLAQFKGKTQSSDLTLFHDVTNIGGATLSSRHVTEGIKRVLATYDVLFE